MLLCSVPAYATPTRRLGRERGGSGRGGVVGDWIEMAAGEGKREEHGTVERDRLGSEILSSYNNYCCPKMKSISLNDLVQGALGYIG